MASNSLYRNYSINSGNTLAGATIGTTETAFFDIPVIKASNMVLGKTLLYTARGVYTTGALSVASLTLRLKVGTTLGSATTIGTGVFSALSLAQTNSSFKVNMEMVMFQVGASGLLEAQGEIGIGNSSNNLSQAGTGNASQFSVDTTVDQKFFLTAQLGGIGVAGATAQLRLIRMVEIQ